MTKQRNQRIVGILSIVLLIFIWAFIQPQSMQAQGQWSTAGNGTDSYTNGQVGIGNSAPADKLDVSGRVRFSLDAAFPGNNVASIYRSAGSGLTFTGYNGTNNSWYFANNLGQDVMYNPVGTTGVNFAGHINIINPSGGWIPTNYLQITGSTSDNSNSPGISFKGGTLANEYPYVQMGNGGLYIAVAGGRHSTNYPNRMQMVLSTNMSGYGYAGFQLFNGTVTTDLLTVKDNGFVGIGTSAPAKLFHLKGSGAGIRLQDAAADTVAAAPFMEFYGSTTRVGWVGDGSLSMDTMDLVSEKSGGVIRMFTGGSAGTNERIRIDSSGQVGIGTDTPGAKLDVNGQIKSRSGGFIFPDGTVQTTAATGSGGSSQWTTSGTSIYYNTGRVGIGTTSPGTYGGVAAQLDVQSASHTILNIGAGTATSNPLLTLSRGATVDWFIRSVGTDSTRRFSIMNGDTTVEAVTVLQNGNVGIGVPSPTKRLEIAGDLNATGTITGGTIYAKYQDVAEWVPSSQKLTAGTVVILDPNTSNQVIASRESYDTRVAGVVSEQPGVILGEGGEGKVKVATTGRVKVKVDASRGPIKIGDLLVTSDKEGLAMKSEPININGRLMHSPGTIIGKALEPLEKGTGEIRVLLSLQ